MRQHVLPTDVEDERDLWLERDEIREVLIGSDAEVNATRLRRAEQVGDHPLIRRLVRDEVIGAKEAVRLREIGDELPKLGVAELRRNVLRDECERRGDTGRGSTDESNSCGDAGDSETKTSDRRHCRAWKVPQNNASRASALTGPKAVER